MFTTFGLQITIFNIESNEKPNCLSLTCSKRMRSTYLEIKSSVTRDKSTQCALRTCYFISLLDATSIKESLNQYQWIPTVTDKVKRALHTHFIFILIINYINRCDQNMSKSFGFILRNPWIMCFGIEYWWYSHNIFCIFSAYLHC